MAIFYLPNPKSQFEIIFQGLTSSPLVLHIYECGLDQDVIRSFKASYRRRYAEYLVSYFNTHNSTPPEIDILQVIHLIANSWSGVPPTAIYSCWQEASISPEDISVFLKLLRTYNMRSPKGMKLHWMLLQAPALHLQQSRTQKHLLV